MVGLVYSFSFLVPTIRQEVGAQAGERERRERPVGIMIPISYLMKKQKKSFYDNIKTILKWGALVV